MRCSQDVSLGMNARRDGLPSAGVAIFAEVRARLTGGQLQQLVPLSLPLLLGVHQPRLHTHKWKFWLARADARPHNPYYYSFFLFLSASRRFVS